MGPVNIGQMAALQHSHRGNPACCSTAATKQHALAAYCPAIRTHTIHTRSAWCPPHPGRTAAQRPPLCRLPCRCYGQGRASPERRPPAGASITGMRGRYPMDAGKGHACWVET